MFCPQCGQQSSEEVRFCHRCGLPLSAHAALLAGDNNAAAASRGAAHLNEQTGKRAGMRRGAKLMFISVVLFPVFFASCFVADSPGPLFVPITVFLAGLVWLVYSRLFGEDLLPVYGLRSREALKAGSAARPLGAPQFVPASLFDRHRANTSEIVPPPPSVTESTTSLLERDVQG